LQGLNDHGPIVFSYELAGGAEGVALATPVPEPGGAAVVGATVGVGVIGRRRTRVR